MLNYEDSMSWRELNEAFLKFFKKKNLKPLFYYYSLAAIKKVDENNCLLS
jgi:hypothetical protein